MHFGSEGIIRKAATKAISDNYAYQKLGLRLAQVSERRLVVLPLQHEA
jgi:hypothetical protein